jgi:flagellar hook-associated protein 2
MANITSLGVGSGLDATGIISSLMAVERRPLSLLQTEQTDLKTQLSSIGKLQGYMSAMRDKSSALTSQTLWGQTSGTSSDSSAVSVSTSNGAAASSYAVNVQNLAAGQTLSSRAFASSASTLNAGTLTIELGAWGAGDPASGFTAQAGKTPVTIEIGPGEATLAAIRDKINASNSGVTASIVNDANGARLSFRSAATGAENAFRISATETSDDGAATNGLSALSYDAASGGSQLSRNQVAVNANATVNGIPISSSTNTLEGVSDGLTLKLLKPTTTAVDVTVGSNTDAVKAAIDEFVKSFNDLAGYIKDQTKYDEASKKGGTLQGDRTVVSMQSQLRGVLNVASSSSSVFGRLSDIGIAMKSDGTLETKSSKLEAGLANLPELQKLLAGSGSDSASSGFMQRFKTLADATLSTSGAFETRNASLNARIMRNTKQQDQMSDRLDQTEARITKQYQTLDTQMAKLNSLSSYVTQQLSVLSFNNN